MVLNIFFNNFCADRQFEKPASQPQRCDTIGPVVMSPSDSFFHFLEVRMKVSSAAITMVAGLAMAASASAATITSTPFSVGYGFSAQTNGWNTTETSWLNTLPSTDFSFGISVVGGQQSNTGPNFTGRKIIAPPAGGSYGESADPSTFGVTLTGTYTGTPGDVDLSDPGYQITINISQISIYGASQTTNSTQSLGFNETTAGHAQSQTPQTIAAGTNYAANGPYTQAVWDPADYSSAATTQVRTFDLSPTGTIYTDGFEVFGTIDVSYNQVPEPASLGLLAAGSLLLLRRRRAM
jgi:hypothetical protein